MSENPLSKEVKNRLILWYLAVGDAHRAMVAEKKFWDMIAGNPEVEKTSLFLEASSALQLKATVLFCQVFNSGSAGTGIAGNKDKEVISLRETITSDVKNELKNLGWNNEKYEETMRQIKKFRDKFTAHYDGSAAKYKEFQGGGAMMQSPGLSFARIEREDVALFLQTWFKCLRKKL